MAATTEATERRPTPEMAPPLQNPPATMQQLDDADARARAAIGGPAMSAGRVASAPEEELPTPDSPLPTPDAGPPASRFALPEETPFEFTPPERQQVRNNNIPLTIGLLCSIVASFLVFFISLAGATAGDDPIMPSFWRALGTLAVLTTLSFAASWFMPAPSERHQLLDRIEAEERLVDDRRARRRPQPAPPAEEDAIPEEPAKGASIDVTLEDELDANQDELAGAEDDEDEEEDDFDDEDEDESLVAAAPAAVHAEQERSMEGR